MDVIIYLFGGLFVLSVLLVAIVQWRGTIALIVFGLIVYAITVYTKYIVVLVFVVSSFMKYMSLKDDGSSSLGLAILAGVKVTVVILLIGFSLVGLLNLLGNSGSSGGCGRGFPLCN